MPKTSLIKRVWRDQTIQQYLEPYRGRPACFFQCSDILICQMHREWLIGIYEWAGRYRTVEMQKGLFGRGDRRLWAGLRTVDRLFSRMRGSSLAGAGVMKTLRSLKNRRLAHTVRNHADANGLAAQIGVMFQQCFHMHKVANITLNLKPILATNAQF